jgi:dihydroxyacetone kinase-like protein
MGKEVLSTEDLARVFQDGLQGIVERGRGVVGDKTMIDALSPAVDVFQSIQGEQNLVEVLRRAIQAAELGMKSTIPLVARKGRASYLGERSRGHQDPGATSSYLILRTLRDVCSRP